MRIRVILLIVVATALCTGNVNSQIISTAKKAVLPEKDKTLIDKQISNYTVFTLDTKELLEKLSTNDHCHVRLYINEQWNWEIDFVPNDREGTFKGKTSDNETVFLSIAENYFHGTILSKRGDYLIRSSWFYTQNFTDKSLIAHKALDIISGKNSGAITDDAAVSRYSEPRDIGGMNPEKTEISGSAGAFYLPCPYYLEIATDADYELYRKYRSDTTIVKKYISDELERMRDVYEKTFNLRFEIVHQHVWTSDTAPGYPYPPQTVTNPDADTLLLQFRRYWNDNMAHIQREISLICLREKTLCTFRLPPEWAE